MATVAGEERGGSSPGRAGSRAEYRRRPPPRYAGVSPAASSR